MTRRKRRGAESSEIAMGELNIVPFLDIVVNLMLFLLATTSAAISVAQVDVEMPAHCVGCRGRGEGLRLSVTLAERGIIVAGRGGRAAPGCEGVDPSASPLTIPRRANGYDFAALEDCLTRLHAQFPREDTVILTADPLVPYEDVISAMDAARGRDEPLFPRVMLSAGVR